MVIWRTGNAEKAGARPAGERRGRPAGGGHELGLVGRENVDRRRECAVGQPAAGENGLVEDEREAKTGFAKATIQAKKPNTMATK